MNARVPSSVVEARRFSNDPTAVYRMYDADGRLLYIGQSVNPAARVMQLADYRRWITDVVKITLEWHPTRQDAIREEERAIREDAPLHNIVYNRGRAKVPT